MKKLSKEKQQQLVLTALVTLLALAGLWYGVIRTQQRNLQSLNTNSQTAREKL